MQMLEPNIEVLIPTFHRPKLLERAIRSVLDQSWSNIIIRVHDNGNDKETEDIMHRLMREDDRVKYLRHKENIGVIANFCSLVNSVDEPFYTIISDDDLLLPWHIESGIKALLKHPDAYFYSSSTITADLISRKLELRNQGWKEGMYHPSRKLSAMVIRQHFTSTGTIFRKDIISLAGAFHPICSDDTLSVLLTG